MNGDVLTFAQVMTVIVGRRREWAADATVLR
jgi:hypothetical protein